MDYIRNSKNRKLKTQILNFFSRVSFSGKKLDIAGRSIILFNAILILSLFFPWIHMKFRDDVSATYSSFSLYSGAIGYGIILGSMAIFFFLFSHQKKERIRAYIPFRLSDAQAIVFVDSMILTGCIEIILVSLQYSQFAINGVSLGIGFVMAISSTLLILVSAFFFSQNEKESGIAMSYLDKKDRDVLSEYQDILDGGYSGKKSPEKEKNMTLPF